MKEKQFTSQKALWPFLLRMFRYSMRYKGWMLRFAFWTVVVSIVDSIFPLILLGLMDNVITPQLAEMKVALDSNQPFELDYSGVFYYAGLWLLLGTIQVIGVFIFIKYAGRVREYIMYELREDLFKKLQQLSFSYYDRSASGWLLTRITSDTDRVCEVVSWGLLDAIWGCTMIVFCTIAMLIYSWKLALIIIICVPLMLIASIRVRLLVLKYSRASRKINSELTASYNEHINGVKVIKGMAQEPQATARFQGLSSQMHLASYRSAYYTAMYMPLVVFTGSIAAALVIFFGGQMALAIPAGITIGYLIAAFEYAMRIFLPIIDISRFYALAQGSLSAGERIFSLLDEEVAIKDAEDATDFDKIKGEVIFDNIGFHYNKENPVLKKFNLKIEPGQSIALVGATGEGKSTIVNLICRFYEPISGHLLIDGEEYRTKTLKSLRSQMGVVLQSPHLFAGTIRENVRYGQQSATDEAIHKALKLAAAENFISRLDEEVGEGGDTLSQGEKQLISLARAILADPAIFIMDEATSAIDTITEAKIQQGIENVLSNRTAIIIAHRLSTIKNCDRILVIKEGAIIEDGAHQVLINAKGHYYGLYTKQLREKRLSEMISDTK